MTIFGAGGGPPRFALVSSALAPLALVLGWVVAEALQDDDYDPVAQTISTLARHGANDRWVMTAGLYAIGVCHLVTAVLLRGARPSARLLLALGGVAGLGIAACAQPDHGSTGGHLAFTVLGVIVLAAFPVAACSRQARTWPLRGHDALPVGLLSAALLVWVLCTLHGPALGVAERAITFQQELWPLLVVLALRRDARLQVDAPRPERAGTMAA